MSDRQDLAAMQARVEQLEADLAALRGELGRGRPKREHPHALHPLDAATWGKVYGPAGHDGKAPVNGTVGGRTFDHAGREW
jgi:hypothetical protein